MSSSSIHRRIIRSAPAFAFFLAALSLPGSAAAQKWNATEVVRITSPRPGGAPFESLSSVAVGSAGDFYLLDRTANALYGYAPDGTYRWKAEVPIFENPLLSMMRDTAALKAMVSSMGLDTMEMDRGRSGGRGSAGGEARDRASRPSDRMGADGSAGRSGADRSGRRAGRSGSGPFSGMPGVVNPDSMRSLGGMVLSLSDGQLAIPDMSGRKTTVFDTTGVQLRTDGYFQLMDAPVQLVSVGASIVGATRSISGMLSSMMSGGKDESGYTIRLMPAQPGGTSREIVNLPIPAPSSFDPSTMTMRINFSPPMPLLASSGDRLFVASNQRYSIDMYDLDFQKVGTIGRNVKRMPLTAADRMRTTREFAKMKNGIPPAMREEIHMEPIMSDSLPAIRALAAGDSIVLVQRGDFVSRDAPVAKDFLRWDVLGWDNSYKGYVDLPAGLTISRISNGRIYATQAEKNEKSAVVYALEPPKSSR